MRSVSEVDLGAEREVPRVGAAFDETEAEKYHDKGWLRYSAVLYSSNINRWFQCA